MSHILSVQSKRKRARSPPSKICHKITMDLDQLAFVDKILKDVDNILRKESELSSFEIVPVVSNSQNKSPVLHNGSNLGLESWCIKHIYMVCYSELMDAAPKPRKKNQTIEYEKIIRLLNVTLLINSDLASLWNRRRELVKQDILDPYWELRFVKIVLSRKPKCNDAFGYRRWILEQLFEDPGVIESGVYERLISAELQICSSTAQQSLNNYHSWSHRIWIIQYLMKTSISHVYIHNLYSSEYNFSEQWSVMHISDHSCFQYRQFCIQNMFKVQNQHWKEIKSKLCENLRQNLRKIILENLPSDSLAAEYELDCKSEEHFVQIILGKSIKQCGCKPNFSLLTHKLELLFYELKLNNDLVRYYKNHEALWYHRRFIIHHILGTVYDFHGVSKKNVKVLNTCGNCHTDLSEYKPKLVRYDADFVFSCLLLRVLTSFDKNVTRDRKEDGDNYADRHEKYLKFIEGIIN